MKLVDAQGFWLLPLVFASTLLTAGCKGEVKDAAGQRSMYALNVNIEGNGAVVRSPDQPSYAAGASVTLTAIPAADAVFDYWWGDYANGADPSALVIDVIINNDSTVNAEFIERPGVATLDFISDLTFFLTAIDDVDTVHTFDANEIEFDGQGNRTYVGNGIPDAAELYLLQTVLKRHNLDLSFQSGITHSLVWRAWTANLEQAMADLAAQDSRVQRFVAAYMTLGDFKTVGIISYLVEQNFQVSLDPFTYDRSNKKFFYHPFDADNDGVNNGIEWTLASPDGTLAHVDAFANASIDGVSPAGAQDTTASEVGAD